MPECQRHSSRIRWHDRDFWVKTQTITLIFSLPFAAVSLNKTVNVFLNSGGDTRTRVSFNRLVKIDRNGFLGLMLQNIWQSDFLDPPDEISRLQRMFLKYY